MTERIIASQVDTKSAGSSLIDLLCRRFTYCSRVQWLAFIDAGQLMVDGKPGQSNQTLLSGQRIEFRPPPDLEPAVDTAFTIIHESSHVIVVYKPPLLPIHPGGRFFAHTLWYLLDQDFGKVHITTRLDRETSGLVLVARDAPTARYLQEQHGLGAIHKTYLALVHGKFPAGMMDAHGWLIKDRQSAVRKKRCFVHGTGRGDIPPEPGAESCRTLLTGKRCWQTATGPCSLVEARLLTGRTHQIRASLYSLGFPVVGDKLYGLDDGFFLRFMDTTLTPEDESRLVLPHQALHCSSLEFRDIEGSKLGFSIPAPWMATVASW